MKSLRMSKAVTRKIDLDQVCMIREGENEYCLYPLDRLMTVLGKKWTLFVIAVLGNQQRMRFNEIQSELGFVSSRTLADRLKELGALGLIQRKPFNEIPPKVEYRLTREGQALRQVLIPLLNWAIEFETGRTTAEGPVPAP
ncbi:MAG: winged helix-turn-helix transcriptional regulator [Candidatus Methylomirabilales bacterium]